jgi:crotonobetainyl-CoA:carnitine CoA-transferase CaiB-like acyl-CoA transferase
MATDDLRHLRVLELSDSIAGGICGLEFALLGANVVRVEGPGFGLRHLEPDEENLASALFNTLHRNKEFIEVHGDTRDESVLAPWMSAADIVVVDLENDHSVREWALDLLSRYARVGVVCDRTISELPAASADELIWQAQSGFMRYLGELDGEPLRVGADIAETTTGQLMFAGALAAHYRVTFDDLTAEQALRRPPCIVSVSGIDALLWMKSVPLAAQSDPDSWQGFILQAPYRAPDRGWALKDGWVSFDFPEGSRDAWIQFVQWLGLGELVGNPDYDDWRSTLGLGDRRHDLGAVYAGPLAERTVAEAIEAIGAVGGVCVPFHDHDSLLADAQVRGWVGWEYSSSQETDFDLRFMTSPIALSTALDRTTGRLNEPGHPYRPASNNGDPFSIGFGDKSDA